MATKEIIRYRNPPKPKKSHRRAGFRLPLAVVAGFTPLAMNIYSVSGQGLQRMGWMATQALTGYDTDVKRWWAPNLNKGLTPIMLGLIVHKIAGRLGINRALGSMGVPLVRI